MKKIFEIIFIAIIAIATIVLTIISYIPHNSTIKSLPTESSSSNYITITIKGEITVEKLEFIIYL